MADTWIPGLSFGPFTFGSSVSPFIDSGLLNLDECQASESATAYKTEDGRIELLAENSRIESVSVFYDFIYKTKNLIGLTEEEVASFIDSPLVYGGGIIYPDESVAYPLERDDLALILWVEEGRVVYATCYALE